MNLNNSFPQPSFKIHFILALIFGLIFLNSVNSYSQVRIGTTNYTTLKAAFDAINAGTHTGNITIQITGNTNETSTAILNASGSGNANYTSVTIYPTGTYKISGSVSPALIQLNGADNVTIDGRVNQSGSTNALTLENTFTTSTHAVIWIDSVLTGTGGGAQNNTIRNCIIRGGTMTNSYGITAGSSASITSSGGGNHNLKILYNQFIHLYYGIYVYGLSNMLIRGLEIKYNLFGSTDGSGSIAYMSMYLYYTRGAVIEENQFLRISGTTTFYGVYCYYGDSTKIINNTYKNHNHPSAWYGIFLGISHYSTIQGNTYDNIITTSTIYGVYLTSTNYCNITENFMTGIQPPGTVTIYLYFLTSSSYNNITNNRMIDLNVGGTIYPIYLSSSHYNKIESNVITDIRSFYHNYGIYFTSANYNLIAKNTIGNFFSWNSTTAYGVYGIHIASGTADTLYNNVIYRLRSTNASATSTLNPFGIYIAGGTGHRIYYNSVNLYGSQEGTNTSGTLSAAIYIASAASSLDMRNNTFTNSLEGRTGSSSYAIYCTGMPASSTFNYNNYFASGTYGILGFLGSNRTSITDWRTATSQDANSFSSNPLYNAPNNLRPTASSPLIGSGVAITGYNRDFLDVTRSSTAPTVGAYEQGGDFQGPTITFTALSNTTSTSNYNVSGIGITDPAGVNTTSGTRPRLYYKRNWDPNEYNDNTNNTYGWKWVEATNTSSPFSFIIDYSKLKDGVAPGTTIQYFFIAQDLASTPNVNVEYAILNQRPSSVNLSSTHFPARGQLNQYIIEATLSGTVTVGSTGTYKSLTNLGGLFDVINTGRLSGNLVVEIVSDIEETGDVALNQWTETGGSGYTLTIRPNSATERKLYGSRPGGLFRLNGADRVTIDGRVSGSGRFLTLENRAASANTAVIHIISLGSGAGATNNTIRNCNIIGGSNTITSIFGIHVGGPTISISATGQDNNNITITENIIKKTYFGIYARGLATANLLQNLSITNNIIGSRIPSEYVTYRGIDIMNCNAPVVTGNEIFNLKLTAIGTNISGIEIGQYCASANISSNKIYGIWQGNTGGWGAYGINISSATGNTSIRIANNVIYDLKTIQYTTGTTYNPYGIRILGGTGYQIYYNTVNLYGPQIEVGTGPSLTACLLITSTAVNSIDLRNNVFANSMTGLTGTKSYCIYLPGTATLTGSTMDYNCYYPSGDYGVLGFLSTDRAGLSDWQNVTSRESNSISTDPGFNTNTVLRPLPNSALLQAGTPIAGLTTDILGTTRSSTAPTIGAYEQGGDFTGPTITYEPLGTSTYTISRTITGWAYITDYSGVNTSSGTRPRLYYKKSTNVNAYNGNTNATDGWKWVEATGTGGSPFSFVIDYSKLYGGYPQVGDIIEYFVVAQDLSSAVYVSINKGEFNQQPSSVNLTSSAFPIEGEINSFRIGRGYAGTYNVGSGQTYTSLTSGGGIFEALNEGVLTGNVIINVTSDLTEAGAIALNQLPEEGGSGFTITIRPSAASTRNITGSSTTSLIRFNGADNVIIDGSFNNSGRYFFIRNTSTSSNTATIHLIGTGNGSRNITIKNCIIEAGTSSTYTFNFAIYAAGTTISSAGSGGDNDNLTIGNNIIRRCMYGIYIRGISGALNDNLKITNNTIGSNTAAEYIQMKGIEIGGCSYPEITDNTIFNVQGAYYYVRNVGIEVQANVNNALIARNKISGIYNTYYYWDDYYYDRTQQYEQASGAVGINVESGSGVSNISIINNMIWDISSYGANGAGKGNDIYYNPFGIRIMGGSNNKVYHNTVFMGTDFLGRTWYRDGAISAALCIGSTAVSNLDVRNNLFINKMQPNSNARNSCKSYAVWSAGSGVFTAIDYNNYSAEGSYGTLGYLSTDRTTIAAWKTATGKDTNSVSKSVTFKSSTDLHLDGASASDTTLTCPNLDIYDDIDKEPRRTRNNNMGADEVVPIIKIDPDITKYNKIFCENESATLEFTASVIGYQDQISRNSTFNFDYRWYKNNQLIPGAKTNRLTFTNLKVSDSADYQADALIFGSGPSTSISTIRVEAPIEVISIPESQDVCEGDASIVFDVIAIGTIKGYQWQKEISPNNWVNIPGQTRSTIELYPDNPEEAAGNYRLRISGPGNCGPATIFTPTVNVTVNFPLENIQTQTSADISSICVGDPIEISVSAEGTIKGFQWQKFTSGTFKNLDIDEFPTAQTNRLIIPQTKIEHTGLYRCLVFGSPKCNTAEVPTEILEMIVWPEIEITKHPEHYNICRGGSVTLEADAEGTVYSFNWQKDGVDIDPATNPSAKEPVFQLNNADFEHSGVYRCRLHIQDCRGIRDVFTKEALVYIHTETEFLIDPPIAITNVGQTVSFRVRAHVDGEHLKTIKVQWYRGTQQLVDGQLPWGSNIAGSQSTILTIRNVQTQDIGNDYWCRIEGICGVDELRNISILIPDINITSQPQNVIECEGRNVALNVSAVPVGGIFLEYQWYRGTTKLMDDGRITGTTTNTLQINNLTMVDEANDYYVKITVQPGGKTVNSAQAGIDVKMLPIITLQPESSIEVQSGRSLSISVSAIGEEPIYYQWFKNDEEIPGETQNTFDIPAVTQTDEGIYKCKVWNECGEIFSSECVVTVTGTGGTSVITSADGKFALYNNQPNPFSEQTIIRYALKEATFIKLSLHDLYGKEIILYEGFAQAGESSIIVNAMQLNLSSGIYYYSLNTGSTILTQPMTIIK